MFKRQSSQEVENVKLVSKIMIEIKIDPIEEC
jgi:hypothetical protein